MRIVFMGTPDFAVPSLTALPAAGHRVVAVVTQPDRPRGRGHRPSPPPVKLAAERADLPVLQPARIGDPAVVRHLAGLQPDAIIVVAFGQYLPRAVLELPPCGCINVHASLLPRYRGASPIQAALAAGDEITGVTTMYMAEGWDTGDIILQRAIPIEPDDDAGTLHDRLARAGAELLVETLRRIEQGSAPRIPQDHSQATYAPRIEKGQGEIDWSQPAAALHDFVRAMTPWPGARTRHAGRTLLVRRTRPWEGAAPPGEPGQVLALVSDEGFVVRTGSGGLLVVEVQPAGGRAMTGWDYVNGYRLHPGDRLGEPTAADIAGGGGHTPSDPP